MIVPTKSVPWKKKCENRIVRINSHRRLTRRMLPCAGWGCGAPCGGGVGGDRRCGGVGGRPRDDRDPREGRRHGRGLRQRAVPPRY
eukprot:1586385-Pyramimonas_sp.AAC.1